MRKSFYLFALLIFTVRNLSAQLIDNSASLIANISSVGSDGGSIKFPEGFSFGHPVNNVSHEEIVKNKIKFISYCVDNDRDGKKTKNCKNYFFDKDGNVTSIAEFDGKGNPGFVYYFTYKFDKKGNMVNIQVLCPNNAHDSISIDQQFDNAGRITKRNCSYFCYYYQIHKKTDRPRGGNIVPDPYAYDYTEFYNYNEKGLLESFSTEYLTRDIYTYNRTKDIYTYKYEKEKVSVEFIRNTKDQLISRITKTVKTIIRPSLRDSILQEETNQSNFLYDDSTGFMSTQIYLNNNSSTGDSTFYFYNKAGKIIEFGHTNKNASWYQAQKYYYDENENMVKKEFWEGLPNELLISSVILYDTSSTGNISTKEMTFSKNGGYMETTNVFAPSGLRIEMDMNSIFSGVGDPNISQNKFSCTWVYEYYP